MKINRPLKALNSAQMSDQELRVINHELRTPLAGILGFTALFERSNLTQEQMEYIDTIELCGKDLLGVIERLTQQLYEFNRDRYNENISG